MLSVTVSGVRRRAPTLLCVFKFDFFNHSIQIVLLSLEGVILKFPKRDSPMKFNDPFGRLENRHKLGYESMRDTMRNNGIETPEEAWEAIKQSKKHALKYMITGAVVLLLVTLVLPKMLPVTLSLALFLVVWIVSSTINGQRYIQRYIDEELESESGKEDDS